MGVGTVGRISSLMSLSLRRHTNRSIIRLICTFVSSMQLNRKLVQYTTWYCAKSVHTLLELLSVVEYRVPWVIRCVDVYRARTSVRMVWTEAGSFCFLANSEKCLEGHRHRTRCVCVCVCVCVCACVCVVCVCVCARACVYVCVYVCGMYVCCL